MLISRGNLKLGVLPSFSLPPVKTCPGMTPFCEKYCFGCHGNYILENVHDTNEQRLDISRTSDFVPRMIVEIRHIMPPALRLHVVGDFYSAEYANKWIEIVRRFPDVHFFGSTRSWRVNKIAKALGDFRDQENVYLRASMDLTDNLIPGPAWSTWRRTMTNDELLDAARKAIEELFSDTSVSIEIAIENLETLRYEIENSIRALKADL